MRRWMTGVGVVLALISSEASAGVVRQVVKKGPSESHSAPVLDASGATLFVASRSDPFGTNPGHHAQALRWDLPATSGIQVGVLDRGLLEGSSSSKFKSRPISITDDGQIVVLVSDSDPLGTNHDRSRELFRMQSDGTGIQQLTDTPQLGLGAVVDAAIAGGGSRIVYRASTDPLGANPGHLSQLFLLDTGTLVVSQLTHQLPGEIGVRSFAISDAGNRLVFSTGGNSLDKIESDGTGLSEVTSSDWNRFAFAGNGNEILVARDDKLELFTWDGGAPTEILADRVYEPSLTDDGTQVVFGWSGGIYLADVVPSTTPVRLSPEGLSGGSLVISGDGSTVAFTSQLEYPGGDNPDQGNELHVMASDGTNIRQLTVTPGQPDGNVSYSDPDLTPDGTRIFYASYGRVMAIDADGSNETQLVGFDQSYDRMPSISGDGAHVVYNGFDFDQSGCVARVFEFLVGASSPVDLAPALCQTQMATVSRDGSGVAFLGFGGDAGVYFTSTSARSVVNPVLVDSEVLFAPLQLDSTGQWVVWASRSDFDGLNPGGLAQLLRGRTNGTSIERVTVPGTDLPYGCDCLNHFFDISGDGDRVVYTSQADPLGTNLDGNAELFLYAASTGTTEQLTSTTAVVGALHPAISADGRWVAFVSDGPFLDATLGSEVYRLELETGRIERAAGLRTWSSGYGAGTSTRYRRNLEIDADGGRIVRFGSTDATNEFPALTTTVMLIDFNSSAVIRPGRDSPTRVDWDVEPSPIHYDVIRGDLLGLQAAAGVVELGEVVCLEEDSPDNTTAGGFEDDFEVAPGDALFFLYRGYEGSLAPPPSWGTSSEGEERTAGVGACSL